MKEEKFKIVQFIRELIINVEKELDNFPKKDIEIKNRIRENCYDLLEIAYEANVSGNIESKTRLIEKSLAKVKIIDFLLGLSYDKQLITHKKLIKLSLKLDDIIKYLSGWYKKLNTN